MQALSYRSHRFPPANIQHGVWLYLRFALSFRDIKGVLAERGIAVSHKAIRPWIAHRGTIYACRHRARRPGPTGRWHFEDVFVSIAGRQMYQRCAFDDEGEILDTLIRAGRDENAVLLDAQAAEEPGGST